MPVPTPVDCREHASMARQPATAPPSKSGKSLKNMGSQVSS